MPGVLPQYKKHPVHFLRGREQPLAIVGREIEIAAPRARSVPEINTRVRNEEVAGIVVPIVALAAKVAAVPQPAGEKQVAIIFKSFAAHRADKLGPIFSRWEGQSNFVQPSPEKSSGGFRSVHPLRTSHLKPTVRVNYFRAAVPRAGASCAAWIVEDFANRKR